MNKVVVPSDVRDCLYLAKHSFGFGFEVTKIGTCVCGEIVREDTDKCCPNCGRKVLWEKVK